MPSNLPSIAAAAAQWLLRAYPAAGGTFSAAVAEIQARQAATVASWLRYPTAMDAALLTLVGPGGSAGLDELVAPVPAAPADDGEPWRTWVDEVVVSWAACLLADPALAADAVAAVADCEHTGGLRRDFRRLTHPDERYRPATALLRHPDLLAPVAGLHRAELLALLRDRPAGSAAA